MSDKTILEHIGELLRQQDRLRAEVGKSEQNTARLKHVAEQLDQCWDVPG